MGMIRRLSDSLFNPKAVLQYRIDKKIVTFLYFIILSLLLMIPSFVAYFTNMSVFDYETKTNIRQAVFNKGEVPYKIENDKLVFTSENEKSQYVIDIDEYNVTLIFTTQEDVIINEDMNNTVIVFNTNAITYRTRLLSHEIIRYDETISADGLDFSLLQTSDRSFWTQAYSLLDEIEKAYNPVIVTSQIMIIVIRSVGTLLIFTLLLTFINRIANQNIYTFGDHFKLDIYYCTAFVLGVTLANLFQLRIIEYIGLFFTFIYSLRINQINISGGNDNEL